VNNSPEIPDFDLIRLIGEGGFGQVWLATNQTTGRLRAVKVIPLHGSTTDPAGREITSITRLEANVRCDHPNLLTIDHVGKTADHLFYVMDPADDISGDPASSDPSYRPSSLQSRLESGPLSAEDCLSYAQQLLEGLARLHNSGMVHRDVKPANCLFVGGQLKLADFGLLTEADRTVSRVGTVKYMPPDGRMDARADVYAAGLVIYEMISGLPAESFPRLGDRGREAADDPILGTLTRLVLRACDPDPQERLADAGEMLGAMASEQGGSRGIRKRRRILVSMGAVVVATVLGVAAWWATRPPRVHVNFVTYPFEATIYLDGTLLVDAEGHPRVTPCTVDDLPARVHHVVFKHSNEATDHDAGEIDFAQQRQIVARWPKP
jgi:serine/threonine protein kinase